MKKTTAGSRIVALAAGSAAGLLALGAAAQAQAWIELRAWPAPRYYDEAPVQVYRDAPRYAAPAVLPRRAVRRIVEQHGFEVIGPIQLRGASYVVPVEDMQGRVQRIVVDATSGELVERLAAGGPPRPPADIGRSRERFASIPPGTDLPPLPLEPRGRLRDYEYGGPVPPPAASERERMARERQARQFPGDVEPPGAVTAPPRPVPPAPSSRANAGPGKPDAGRSRAAEKPKAGAEQQAGPARATAAKPQAEAALREVPVPPPRPDALKSPAPKAEPVEEAAKPDAAATRSAKASPPEKPVAERDAEKPAENRNAEILRRPSQRTGEGSGERTGVAEAPVVSSGAAPQRKSPRVVYPGPGAPQTTPPPGDGGE